jgi:hypothetical protein
MQTSLFRFSILALSAVAVMGSAAVQAAPYEHSLQDTPMLVDKYLEIRDPQQLVGPPIELKEGYVLRTQPSGDPLEGVPMPDPQGFESLVGN